jgi:predicted dehydrogenase
MTCAVVVGYGSIVRRHVRLLQQQVVAIADGHTFVIDFVRGILTRDGEERLYKVDPDDTYLARHRAVLAGDTWQLCDFEHGEAVMRLIAAAKRAARDGTWVAA